MIESNSKTDLASLLTAIDQRNRQDPRSEEFDGQNYPKELLYGQRMSATLARFKPDASEELQIAARAQHIQRWQIPRADYPPTRPGYLQWRRDLGKFHAQRSAELMTEHGYSQASINTVSALLQKQNIKQNPEAQALEDVICLVFVQYYLADFGANKKPDKLANIIRRTWEKMSAKGQTAVLALDLNPSLQIILNESLAV